MVAFDVESIKNRMIDRLKVKASWEDLLFYSTNLILIETFAEELHYLADYDAYLTKETKWGLANNRTSLLSAQDLHGYQARKQVSSIGKLRVSSSQTFDSNHTVDIFIQKYALFKTSSDIKFISKDNYVFSKTSPNGYIYIDVIQGEFKTETFTAVGIANEKFNISNVNIENTSLIVYVNDILYTIVDSLYTSTSTSLDYITKLKIDDNTLDIVFGDGIYGKKLLVNDTVKVTYIETKGILGNITGLDIINKVVTNIKTVEGNSIKMYCTNTEILIGGSAEEDIESIRYNATDYFQTGDRAVTITDYEALITQLNTFISKLSIWGVYEYNIDNNRDMWAFLPAEENVVNICALAVNDGLGTLENLNTTQKNYLTQSLLDKKSPTDILRFTDATKIDVIFTVNAFVKDKSYLLNNVTNATYVSLEDNFGYTNMDFFEHLYFSDYIRIIDETPGVDYHNTTLQIQDYFDFATAYTLTINTSVYTITKLTLDVFVLHIATNVVTKIGYDKDGDGLLYGMPGYNLTGSSINYNNGVGSLVVVSGLTGAITDYKVLIRYKLENNNVILNNRTQILGYSSTYSTVNCQYTN
jgi:hypothetical protein